CGSTGLRCRRARRSRAWPVSTTRRWMSTWTASFRNGRGRTSANGHIGGRPEVTGLPRAAGAADTGDLDVRLVGRDRDAATGVLGWPSVLATTRAPRSLVRDQIDDGAVPFLVGGCCTLLPGALGGARDALGAIGLAYLDGHLDLYDGRTSPTGEPADMGVWV